MTKPNWQKDRQLRGINHSIRQDKESIYDLAHNAGKPMYSPQLKQYVSPKRGRHIDPESPEGKEIAKRYGIHD
jgi:hypothetical protein